MKFYRQLSLIIITGFLVVLPAMAQAGLTAHQTVEKTTTRVKTLIDEASVYYEQEPERFYNEVFLILDDIVDFKGFARGVMGPYASRKYYAQLATPEEKKAFRAQVMRFSDTFKDGLVQTYAKGLLAFGGTRIEVVPPADDISGRQVTVLQKIYGKSEKPYEVFYKMRLNKKGVWKLRNITIEAVNLGKVYQGQFISAVKQYEGDIDKVIDNWSVTPQATVDAG
jgi:phospholipid transport system substrate-binding protein